MIIWKHLNICFFKCLYINSILVYCLYVSVVCLIIKYQLVIRFNILFMKSFFLKFPYINIILSTYKCFGRTSLILSFCLIILYFQNNTCQMLPQHFNISSTLMLTMVIIQIYVYVAYKFQFILQISSVVHLLLNLIFL